MVYAVPSLTYITHAYSFFVRGFVNFNIKEILTFGLYKICLKLRYIGVLIKKHLIMNNIPTHDAIRKISTILATIANRYMKSFQGDIIHDYMGIIERLRQVGEVECYVSTGHFDTEKRFEFGGTNTIDKAREKAREDHWGEYIILIKVDGDKVSLGVESDTTTKILPIFPMTDLTDKAFACVDEVLFDKRTPLTVDNIRKMCDYDEENKCYIYTPTEYQMFDFNTTHIQSLIIKDGNIGGITEDGTVKESVLLDEDTLKELQKDLEEFFEKYSWMKN